MRGEVPLGVPGRGWYAVAAGAVVAGLLIAIALVAWAIFACLLAGRWTDGQRADAADAYYTELAGLGRPIPERERYLRTLDYCLIHLSVRNLGWSADWTPPSDRVHDWLGEALRLCEKWNL